MQREGRGDPPLRSDGGPVRVGIGYDSHRFVANRPLVLGGIVIPSDVGLLGHSDGDAICHAITDAILGAAGLGDIGELFPDSDEANRDRNSIEMLKASAAKVASSGYEVHQVDVAVIGEIPRILPHRDKMRTRIGLALGIEPHAVSVKGKSNEGMGWIGRKEGLACIAVVTLRGNR